MAEPYDVIARTEARSMDDLGKLVVSQIHAVNGVTRTLTCAVTHLQADDRVLKGQRIGQL